MKLSEFFDQKVRKPFINWWYQKTFFNACKKGKLNIVHNLINKGVNPYLRDKDGKTALHYAGTKAIVNELVDIYGIDINDRDRKSSTPLHHAAEKGKYEVVKALLDKGANPIAWTNKSKKEHDCTPLDLVQKAIMKETHWWVAPYTNDPVSKSYPEAEFVERPWYDYKKIEPLIKVKNLLIEEQESWIQYRLEEPNAPPAPPTPKHIVTPDLKNTFRAHVTDPEPTQKNNKSAVEKLSEEREQKKSSERSRGG